MTRLRKSLILLNYQSFTEITKSHTYLALIDTLLVHEHLRNSTKPFNTFGLNLLTMRTYPALCQTATANQKR